MNKVRAILYLFPQADHARDFRVQYDGSMPQMLNGQPRPQRKVPLVTTRVEEIDGEEVVVETPESEWVEGVNYEWEFVPWDELTEGVDYEMVDTVPYVAFWNVKDDQGNPVPQPTEAELQAAWDAMNAPDIQLAQAKKAKKSELSAACSAAVLGRFTAEVNGVTYYFSNDTEAQSNFAGAAWAFSNGYITEQDWTAHTTPDQQDDVVRVTLTTETFIAVNVARLLHGANQVSRLRDQLDPLVDGAESMAEVDAIVW